MLKQRTIKHSVRASGIGLHSGKQVNIRLCPHHEDGGIVFRRTDLQPAVDLPARAHLIQESFMCSNLIQGNAKVGTVEHLMSAVAALGIDNLLVEVDAPELPILDGSAAPFLFLLLQAELNEQTTAKKFIQIIQPVEVKVDDKFARFEPYDGFLLDFTIDFKHPIFAQEHQNRCLELSTQSYTEQVSQARTFGFLKDLEYLQANNLALGASLENAIGLDENSVLNEEGLRFADEFVRHKILDAVGDLYLLGHQILAKFTAYKAGHAVNNQLLRTVFDQPDCYRVVTSKDFVRPPINYVPV
ncbi:MULTISPECIES: UDP-3-O-acyl-N-acetylglucosamine deacetylase [unclassified Acinetobacter]|uniref:UDP-3-O-acyl-N-acetylglucosamine deacetylase n=1 Tax=unclassified Acinetobacter TaxID=196816 RepID=UPI0035B916A8